MSVRLTTLVLLASAPGVAFAAGDASGPDLRRAVLQRADVPATYAVGISSAYTPAQIAAQGTYTRAQLRAWGYRGGYERQYTREDESSPAQISSDVGSYSSAAGASRSLAMNTALCERGGFRLNSRDVGLGAESRMCLKPGTIRGQKARVVFVVWRIGKLKGALTMSTLAEQSSTATALRFARKQVRRMR